MFGRMLEPMQARRRSDLHTMLLSHEPTGDKERRDRDLMLELAQTLRDPLSPHEEAAHFTASALVVDEALERVCLVHHRKLDRWLQPGGHIEPTDETLLAAAMREVAEETSLRTQPFFERPLDLDVHEFPEREGRRAHLHLGAVQRSADLCPSKLL